ncbi:MAG: 4-hydroxythreonine-4-phosphate dehydrogenase PdxA [Candidatus Pelagibacter bacterium]|nr:4-hydroxythreonine-4-phosphate dehydrogenase PdxA [Candidatus Pelagibacter bacterium]MBL6860878.1 4-hydroxythreonine-4-phosphate dehydrogenase PdxA [Candidatus Pelagibacter bacterium]
MKKKIIIVAGDPESINSEILFKSWIKLSNQVKKKIYLISNVNLLNKQFKKLGIKIDIENTNINSNSNKLKVIDVKLRFKNPFKINRGTLKKYIKNSLNIAHNLATKDKNVIGIINCPIKKNLLELNNVGVTEFFAKKCSIKNNSEVMVIRNNKLAVALITTHYDLKNVANMISKNLIIKKIKTIHLHYKRILNKKPEIGVLGLNPHNAELRKNSEEIKKITPAIKSLKKLGIKVFGPLVADTVFIEEYKKFDVIVGMYHDQVLTPFKAMYKFDAINFTLGLNYLRVSPDHGVAINLIGKNKADENSLLQCIKFINKFG